MDTKTLFSAALGLVSPWVVTRTDFSVDDSVLEICVDFQRGATFVCPECGAQKCAVHDTVEKRWRHMDFFQHQAFIVARTPRISCDKCGVRLVSVPWARPGAGFTLLMEGLILELARVMPIHNVAQLLRVSGNRIWRVIFHYVMEALKEIDCSLVTCVGVDETSAKKRHDYISCFFDLVKRRLLFAAPGRSHKVVAEFATFIESHKGSAKAISEVSSDMSPAFIKGVKKSLPKASVTFDRFHVAKLLTDAVEKVRRSEWRKDKTVKGSRFALLKNPENLTEKQKKTLTEIMNRNMSLAEAYRMKETFRDFYQQSNHKEAKGFLKGWIATAMQSKLKPLIQAAKTMQRRSKGILRWHFTHISNAVMEGLNSLLQAAKRKARGYRLKKTFIVVAYLIAGKLDLHAKSPFAA